MMRDYQMKEKKRIYVLILALLAAVVCLAYLHLSQRPAVSENSLLVSGQGKEITVSIDALPIQKAEGVLVNGKGEEKEISEDAVILSDVLKAAEIDLQSVSSITLTASDEYSASYSIDEADHVYLVQDEEKGITAFIFTDHNAKRRIHDVSRVEVK